jgi:hypothetical protein
MLRVESLPSGASRPDDPADKNHMKWRSFLRVACLACAIAAVCGCTMRQDDVSYNPYARNQGRRPVILWCEEHGPGAADRALNDLDARLENLLY